MEQIEIVKQYFKDNGPITVPLYPSGQVRKFTSFEKFREFMTKQYEFWKEIKNPGPSVQQIISHFSNIIAKINNALNATVEQQVQQNIENAISIAKINTFPAIYADTDIARLIVKYKNNHDAVTGIAHYLQGAYNNQKNFWYMRGFIEAYLTQELGASFYQVAASNQKELDNFRTTYVEELNELHLQYDARMKQIEQDSETFKSEISSWADSVKNETETFLQQKQQNLEQLEEIYREKLRLEGPAKYWDSLYKYYNGRGKLWVSWVVVLTISLLIGLTIILYTSPDALFPKESQLTFNSFKGTFIFVLITSIAVYLVTLFTKLAISSFHLARDAKERYQMTYVYLSLINENAIQETERGIVLSSIFSRADTGLLKGDSSPAFPDSALSQIFKNLQK